MQRKRVRFGHNTYYSPEVHNKSSPLLHRTPRHRRFNFHQAPNFYCPYRTLRTWAIQLHLILRYPTIIFDLSLPPPLIRAQPSYSGLVQVMMEPATYPPLLNLTIVSADLLWPIHIYASGNEFVTVRDIIETLYYSLRINATEREFKGLGSRFARHQVNSAYQHRYRRIAYPQARTSEKAGGLKRIDFLRGRTLFMGLSATRENLWVLSTS